MNLVIKQGRHRPFLPPFGIYLDKKEMDREICFTVSCAYTLPGDSMQDINKLFGIGYFPNHQRDSARFGWRYDELTNRIKIFAYSYVSGIRHMHEMCSVAFREHYRYRIKIARGIYSFEVWEMHNGAKEVAHHVQEFYHRRKWSYKLGFYFGGNLPAPKDMKIEIRNV